MARKRRECPAGTIFHLCNRAAGQVTLLQTDYDYLQILKVLREALEKFPVKIFAYCLMPNHWHLLIQPQEPKTISRFMHWFGTTHAIRYRKSHQNVGCGAVYQNRFRSHPVVGRRAFLKTVAYIERNALAASLVHEASHWPWGSAAKMPSLQIQKWPVPRPAYWSRILQQPLGQNFLHEILHAEISTEAFYIPEAVKPQLHEVNS